MFRITINNGFVHSRFKSFTVLVFVSSCLAITHKFVKDTQSQSYIICHHHKTCTVAKALNVTFLGNSVTVELRDLITGFSGGRDFATVKPADVANSLNFVDKPKLDLFDGTMICGNVVGVMYLEK